jgi:hypothetical protein
MRDMRLVPPDFRYDSMDLFAMGSKMLLRSLAPGIFDP